MKTIQNKPRVILLRMGKVPFMDITGEYYFSGIIKELSKHGVILISGLKPQPKSMLKKTGIYDFIGEEHFFEHTGESINFALKHLNTEQCFGCRHFAFRECAALSCQKSDIGQLRSVPEYLN